MILVLDFGGQYNQLIARRVRENNVYCEVHTLDEKVSVDKNVKSGLGTTINFAAIRELKPEGIILTGGPQSVYEKTSSLPPAELFNLNIPVLGICYGAQAMVHVLGGKVDKAEVKEYGKTSIKIATEIFQKLDFLSCMFPDYSDSVFKKLYSGFDFYEFNTSKLFDNVEKKSVVWMSHGDRIFDLPKDFVVTASSENCPIAAAENSAKKLYAVQFHPEVLHTVEGKKIFSNFVDICGCKRDWKMDTFVNDTIAALKNKIGNGKVLCALSGGVDSSVAAVMLSKAVGKNLTCVFVNHGLLRKNEAAEVAAVFKNYDLNFVGIDASERFLSKLKGVTEPERKRKIIGEEFIRVFEEVAKKIGAVDFLVQGTIYPDVIESGLGKSAVIKSHHNVGGLPDFVYFKEIIEPLRLLFKDEVREAGRQLGLPENIVSRQPFPGPGLGIRIIGEVTAEKIKIVQDADAIYREEIFNAGIAPELGQYFAALSNMRSVGVMGDGRTYDYAIVLRAVLTSDFMTAEAAQLDWKVLNTVANRIVNEVKGVNRVLYDCTSKPPATIEFE